MLYSFFGFWVLFSDPFGLSAAADRALFEQLERLRAFIMPAETAPITVLAIDYPSIEGLHNNGAGWMSANDWPITYADHSRILRDLASPLGDHPAPAAIFYDILFERPRAMSGDMASLGRLLTRLQADAAAPAVYLAGGGSYVPISETALKQLQQPLLAVSAWEGVGDFYPLRAPLGDPDSHPSAFTAASALYRELCRARNEDCSWLDAGGPASLVLQWNVADREGCRAEKSSVGHELLAMLRRLGGRSATPYYPPAACMPVHQVRLSELYGDTPASIKPPHLSADEPFVVLVGNVMPSLNDYVSSPLYGQVAGVYLHAHALANLNEKGDHYIRDRDFFVFNLCFLLLTILFGMWRQGTLGWRAQEVSTTGAVRQPIVRRVGEALADFALYSFLVLLVYSAFYLLARIPNGWLAFIPLFPFLREVVIAGESKYRCMKENRNAPTYKSFTAVGKSYGLARSG